MRSVFTVLSVIAMTATSILAWPNSPHIPERHPGWTEGKGQQMIEFEVFYDLTCGTSSAMHPELKKFLDSPFLGRTVRDAITVNYVFSPLPYHHASWIPHKILPYIIDKCLQDTLGCKMRYYIDFSFNN